LGGASPKAIAAPTGSMRPGSDTVQLMTALDAKSRLTLRSRVSPESSAADYWLPELPTVDVVRNLALSLLTLPLVVLPDSLLS